MKSLLQSLFKDTVKSTEPSSSAFSLAALQSANPALAAQFVWRTNELPDPLPARWLHWGCSSNVFDEFVNVDFAAGPPVLEWDFLDDWPTQAAGRFEGAFSEDTLEHFFLGEQAYILCNLNVLLKRGGVSRILMPSWRRLMALGPKAAAPGEFLRETFGVATEVDAMNVGLRFSGHRWLHDAESLAFLAADCGFNTVPTSCAESTVAWLSNRNLRSEDDSASFATDLVKRAELRRIEVLPAEVAGAERVEVLEGGIEVWHATAADAQVRYALDVPMSASTVALANIRSANLSEFRSHYYKSVAFCHTGAEGVDAVWRFDETLKSKPCMNLVTRQQIRQATVQLPAIDGVRFRPVSQPGQYFTLGPLELFLEAP
ncbi:MAG: hypothetical protein JNM76_01615 [Betaproteobacteria bacterium]|nr:hypothetical protein [Betaproteobacteria bacterium]